MDRKKLKKYGKCTNEKCENYRQVVEVIGGNMVCEKCKGNLMECPPPRPQTPWKKYVAIACGVAVLGGGGYLIWDQLHRNHPAGDSTGPDTVTVDSAKTDTVVAPPVDTLAGTGAETVGTGKDSGQSVAEKEKMPTEKENSATKSKKSTAKNENSAAVFNPPAVPGALNLGYATYTGQTKNGKPHGTGKLVYKKSKKIVASQDYVASPGDTYEGQFRDGKVSGGPGTWTHNGVPTEIMP